MAKKTNKTSHVLNLITSGEPEKPKEPPKPAAAPETNEKRVNDSKVTVVNADKESSQVSEEIQKQLLSQLEEKFAGTATFPDMTKSLDTAKSAGAESGSSIADGGDGTAGAKVMAEPSASVEAESALLAEVSIEAEANENILISSGREPEVVDEVFAPESAESVVAQNPEPEVLTQKPAESIPAQEPEQMVSAQKSAESVPMQESEQAVLTQKPAESVAAQNPESVVLAQKPAESVVVQNPEPGVPEQKPAERVAEQEPEEPHSMVNVMEQILKRTSVLKYMKEYEVCTCSRCRADVLALILTRLPAKYVVVDHTAVNPIISYYESKYRMRILTEMIKSCIDVRENPRHEL